MMTMIRKFFDKRLLGCDLLVMIIGDSDEDEQILFTNVRNFLKDKDGVISFDADVFFKRVVKNALFTTVCFNKNTSRGYFEFLPSKYQAIMMLGKFTYHANKSPTNSGIFAPSISLTSDQEIKLAFGSYENQSYMEIPEKNNG